jgi:TRAP-type C4-dicarboxylate transport system permease large subunit
LFGAVWGGLYIGLFTDSEAASVGAVGTFIFAILRGRLRMDRLFEVMSEVSQTLAMIFPLIFGAVTFSFLVALLQLPDMFADFLLGANLTPLTIVCLLILSYLVLGTVVDSFAIMFITAPIYSVIIMQLGYDPIWWGIMTVICVEIGVISPPFGLNLFILRSVVPKVKLSTMYAGVLPFCVADVIKVIILISMPWLVLS